MFVFQSQHLVPFGANSEHLAIESHFCRFEHAPGALHSLPESPVLMVVRRFDQDGQARPDLQGLEHRREPLEGLLLRPAESSGEDGRFVCDQGVEVALFQNDSAGSNHGCDQRAVEVVQIRSGGEAARNDDGVGARRSE